MTADATYRAIRPGAAMVFRSRAAVVYRWVCGGGGALFVLRIADKVHTWRVVQRWSHRLEVERNLEHRPLRMA
jgi:hypothetical protein